MEELLVNTTNQMKKQLSISKGYEFTSIEIYERYISWEISMSRKE